MWEDRGECLISLYPQGSPEWLKLREGVLTGSQIAKVTGDSKYFDGDYSRLARLICGKEKEEFKEYNLECMRLGNLYEPKVRRCFSKKIGKNIEEVGMAVWKKDKRFCPSIDGVIDDKTGIEIKCPKRIYRDFKENGEICVDHYYQMTMNGVVFGMEYMYYIVYGIEDKEMSYTKIKIDYDLWYNYIYPKSVKFYNEYIVPIL